jgi:sulfite dehydrogenase (quinone) subunit SoeC
MRPAWSVVLLTTLIGAGQGLFAAAFASELLGAAVPRGFFVAAAAVALVLTTAGLVASFFHLGRPERAWRTAAMWRTSWLSREVIALPAFMAAVAGWGLAHHVRPDHTLALGTLALAACLALFVCTAMIYACMRFLQEWASPLTLLNFVLMGLASGTTLAAALAAAFAPSAAARYAAAALVLAVAAFAARSAALARNAGLRSRSTVQTATGLEHRVVRQVSQGFTAGAFNTKEFFHGRSAATLRHVRLVFPLLAFVAPGVIAAVALASGWHGLLAVAFAVQYGGLLLERWYFFAEARHPQNLYYQRMA